MLPFGPADAVMVIVSGENVALMVCAEWTLVKV
jgi:hypothetical protein